MARQIEAEVKNILKQLLQQIAKKRTIAKIYYKVPSDNLANWYAAMEFLQSINILDFEVVDNHDNPYNIGLVPGDEYMELRYRITTVSEAELKELCSKYNIVIPKESSHNDCIESNPAMEIAILKAFSDTSPYIQKDGELIYRQKQDRLDLIVDDETYQISLRSGQVRDIVSVAANSDYVESLVSKGLIEQEIGHAMSDPLTTIMKDSIFMNELSNFAHIEPKAITIYRNGVISEEALQELKHKNYVKVVNR